MLVTTGEISNLTANSGEVTGMVIDLGAGATQHGHCYSTNPNVSIAGTKSQLGLPSAGGFTSQLTNLDAGTKYYIKAYISNGTETVYGKEINFTTLQGSAPDVTTAEPTSITSTTASSGGNVTDDGGAAVTVRGVCWNTATGPSISNSKTTDGDGTGSFTSNLTSLTPGTTYYVRAYATNSAGTTYGDELDFITLELNPPTAITETAAPVTGSTATLNGSVNANGKSTAVTFEYGLTTGYGNSVTASQSPVSGTNISAVSADIGSLSVGTTYHFRVKAVSSDGTAYGEDQTFTTNCTAPSATTIDASSVLTTTATLNGTVNANNSSTIVTFEYGKTTGYGSSVTATQSPLTGITNAAVSAGVTSLTPNTLYHFRVKTVNCGGTIYGSDLTFTTNCLAATSATNAATSFSTTTATLNGTVNANNASTTVTFEYGTTTGYGSSVTAIQSPLTGMANTSVSAGITSLSPNTLYHYRVKTVNCGGTIYGSDMTFSTLCNTPTSATNAATLVSTTSATLNGAVNANNSSTIVTFEYGKTTAYGSSVTADQSPVTGSISTSVDAVINGLSANVTYHFRVKSVNCGGTTYGNDQSFTTLCFPPSATTNAATSVTSGTATFNGSVNANGFSTTVIFEYGTTTGYGSTITATQSPVTGSSNTAVSAGATGLSPGTYYHYRVKTVNCGGTIYGSDRTFSTPCLAPIATTKPASGNIAIFTLKGTVNPNGCYTTVTFEWSSGFDSGIVNGDPNIIYGNSDTNVNGYLYDLLPGVSITYRVKAVNSAGTTYGNYMGALPSLK